MGRRRNPSPSTHNHTTHPCQEWRRTSVAGTQTHKHPNTPARSGGTQPKPKPKRTHPRCTPQPGVAGYERGAHTSTYTPQHPSQEWRDAAKTRAQTHTHAPHTPARNGGVQGERAHEHTHPNTPTRSGEAQPKAEPKQRHPHHTPQPGVAGYKRSGHMNTHTPQHPSQEWQGAAETRAQAHTSTPHTPARSGGVQAERAHKHTPTPSPQPGVAGRTETRPQTQPGPTHNHHTTVGNPVSIARALRQPVPCR